MPTMTPHPHSAAAIAQFRPSGRLVRNRTSRPTPRAHEQAGHHGSQTERAFQVQLRDGDRRGAVRNQAHEGSGQHREERACAHELGKGVFPHRVDDDLEREGHQEDERGHLQRVPQRGAHHRMMLLAGAVLLLAQLVDMELAVSVTVQAAQHEVDEQARRARNGHLRQQDAQHEADRHLLGNEEGHHLVGRGEEDRQQRAHRDNAAGVQRGRRRREPALRHDAEHRADEGAGLARFLHRRLGLVPRLVLDGLHGQVRHE